MWNDNDKVRVSACERETFPMGDGVELELMAHGRRKSSVLELERMAGNLRDTDQQHAIESIDLEILSLLERKIFRKVVARGRRARWASLAPPKG
jgi:hypothetical protein